MEEEPKPEQTPTDREVREREKRVRVTTSDLINDREGKFAVFPEGEGVSAPLPDFVQEAFRFFPAVSVEIPESELPLNVYLGGGSVRSLVLKGAQGRAPLFPADKEFTHSAGHSLRFQRS